MGLTPLRVENKEMNPYLLRAKISEIGKDNKTYITDLICYTH